MLLIKFENGVELGFMVAENKNKTRNKIYFKSIYQSRKKMIDGLTKAHKGVFFFRKRRINGVNIAYQIEVHIHYIISEK